MGELAVGAVDRPPLVGEGEDLVDLPGQEAVDGVAARREIPEAPGCGAFGPPPVTLPVDAEDPAGPLDAPPGVDRAVDERQQLGLGGGVDPAGDRTVQAQPAFPRNTDNSIA